jgi:hypothetical protein
MAVAVLTAGIVALLAGINQRARGPFGLKVLSTEPSGIVDESGNESVLVEIQVVNRGIGVVFCRMEHRRVEARIGGRWVEAKNLWGIGTLRPHEQRRVVFVLPGAADRCRIAFEYECEPMQISLFHQLGPSYQQGAARIVSKRVYRWLWPYEVTINPSGWKPIDLKVRLPQNHGQHVLTPRQARNYCPRFGAGRALLSALGRPRLGATRHGCYARA